MESAPPAGSSATEKDDVPAFRRRAKAASKASPNQAQPATEEQPGGPADALPDSEPTDDDTAAAEDDAAAADAGGTTPAGSDQFQEDEVPPYAAARPDADAVREAEREMERAASGFTAEETLGANGKPLPEPSFVASVDLEGFRSALDMHGTQRARQSLRATFRASA